MRWPLCLTVPEQSRLPVGSLLVAVGTDCKLAELADSPHRHEKAADWQTGLLRNREIQRPTHLRTSEGGHAAMEGRYSWLGRYIEWVEGKDGREEYCLA